MAQISRVTTFSPNTTILSSEVNAELNSIVSAVNSLDNDNLAATANISPAKISAAIAGSAITRNSGTGALSPTVDDSTIEISSSQLAVKDAGITTAKLASAAITLLAPPGAVVAYCGATAPTGWVLASGATIGNASSGGTSRANADTENLFTLLWSSFSNTELAIQDSSGSASVRGASAAVDYAANKRMPLPDLRGRVPVGKDDLGGSAASRMATSITGTTLGAAGGTERHTLTASEMPTHTHSVTDPGHSHEQRGEGPGGSGGRIMRVATNASTSNAGVTTAAAYTGISLANAGSGSSHLNTQPSLILGYIIKL